jgi:uncharacterized membrane protein YccC
MFVLQLGSMMAPFVVPLGVSGGDPDLPQAVFGGAMAAAAAAFLFTQETRGRPLAQTVRDLQDEERRAMLKC